MSKTQKFTAEILKDDDTSGCAIVIPFDPKELFGRVRVPVTVTVNGYTYTSTICALDGRYWIPVNKTVREGAKVAAGEKVKVEVAEDAAPRVVKAPADLAKLLKADAKLKAAWEKLSFSHKREHVGALEEAKKPETRARRLEKLTEALRAPKKSR
jgi:hypothetical protein